jgi:hypothetical protein
MILFIFLLSFQNSFFRHDVRLPRPADKQEKQKMNRFVKRFMEYTEDVSNDIPNGH